MLVLLSMLAAAFDSLGAAGRRLAFSFLWPFFLPGVTRSYGSFLMGFLLRRATISASSAALLSRCSIFSRPR